MRFRAWTPALVSAAMMLAAGVARAGDVQGEWLTEDGLAKVRIAPCGEALCGHVVWMKNPIDPRTGRPQLDARNPDPALKTRPAIGLQILNGLKRLASGHWRGSVYDPESGRTYAARLAPNPDGTLKVEGCLAMLCEAQTWTPAG